jgi:hypothetical protein
MWDAMAAMCEVCRLREALGRAKKRIILITDGEDATTDDQMSVCREVLDSRVILDALILANSHEQIDRRFLASLLPFALHSGGYCFCPKTVDEAVAIIQKEDFSDQTIRSPKKCQADRRG